MNDHTEIPEDDNVEPDFEASDDELRSELSSEIYPPWKQAVENAVKKYTYGDVIPDAWLYEQFGIEMPDGETMLGSKVDELRLRRLNQLIPFKKCLIEEHQMALERVKNKGFLILQPSKQAEVEYEKRMAEVRNSLCWLGRVIVNVNYSMLSSDERRKHDEYLIRVVRMQDGIRTERRLKMLPDARDEENE